MAKVLLNTDKKAKYAQWIASIQEKACMDDEVFVEYVVHYVKKAKSERVEDYMCFHVNSVKNWIHDNKPPVDVCSFLCFALLDYECSKSEKSEIPCKPLEEHADTDTSAFLALSLHERNRRYDYVKEQMWNYLQMRLYTRNLHDALLIQVARGIYSFKELKKVKEQLNQMISGTKLTKEEKERVAVELATDIIEKEMERIETKEQFESLVNKYAKHFLVGNATVGKRLKKICEEKNKEDKKYSIKQAAAVYAPRYKDTYDKTYETDLCVSRDWLMELCYKMGLNLEETNSILYAAGMYETTEDELTEMFKMYPYSKSKEAAISDKLAYALAMTAYLMEYKEMQLLPIDYMLDYFWDNGGEKRLANLQEKLRTYYSKYKADQENGAKLSAYINDAVDDISFSWGEYDESSSLYQAYRKRFIAYYHMPERKVKQSVDTKEADCIHFLAAFIYSLFLGKKYEGSYSKKDNEELLKGLGGKEAPYGKIYAFINNVLVTFLGKSTLNVKKNPNGKTEFYITKEGAAKHLFSLEMLLLNFYRAWLISVKK